MIAYLHAEQDGVEMGGYYLRVNDRFVAFVNYALQTIHYFHGRGVVTCDGFTTAKDTHAALQALAALRFGVTEIRFEQSNTVPFTE